MSKSNDWDDMAPAERANAFRAHHSSGMPYPNEVDVDAELEKLQRDKD